MACLNVCKAQGPDDISMHPYILKECCESLYGPLLAIHIFIKSLDTGTISQDWKS